MTCKAKQENNGVCPHHNLQCGWPKCNEPEQPAQQEPVAWADECRISLVTAIHFLASDYENALGVFRDDTEARRKAEGDIAHARKIAAKWNWNGASPPAQRTWVGLTDEEILAANYPDGEENGPTISAPDFELDCFAKQVEAKLRSKNEDRN
jgi:hypothetical protein